jgi:hypothetical protein
MADMCSMPGRAACCGERLRLRGRLRQAGMALAALAANGKAIAYMFGLSSALAVVHNLVNYKLVQHTSAVSATVIGEVKTIALIILSAFLLGARPAAAPEGAERWQKALHAPVHLSRQCLAEHVMRARRGAAPRAPRMQTCLG